LGGQVDGRLREKELLNILGRSGVFGFNADAETVNALARA